MDIDVTARAPKYQRIADELRRRIRDGRYKPNTRIPAETELTEQFSVSLPTVRQALAALRAEGLVESRQGIGTFVKDSHKLRRRSRHRYGRARADQQLLTSHLRHEIVSAGPEPVPAHIAAAFPGDTSEAPDVVVRRRILRDPDTGRAEEIGASYIPASIAAGTYLAEPTVVPKALFLCLEDLSGQRYAYAHDRWEVRPPTATEAMILGLAAGAAVVHLLHTAESDEGEVLEVSESVWPADRVVILDEYAVPGAADVESTGSEI
jgi:GntR family transcriptional regulator